MKNNNVSEYEYFITMDRHCDIVTVTEKGSDKSFTFHLSSNYQDYSIVPSNIYCSEDNKMIVKRNDLPNNWSKGNFNFFTEGQEKIRRMTQYEYDKACFEGRIQTKDSDNSKFYEYVTNKLRQL